MITGKLVCFPTRALPTRALQLVYFSTRVLFNSCTFQLVYFSNRALSNSCTFRLCLFKLILYCVYKVWNVSMRGKVCQSVCLSRL